MSKYYVVSEEELNSYKRETLRAAHTHEVHNLENTQASLVCRAREVTLKSTFRNGVGGGVKLWEEVKK